MTLTGIDISSYQGGIDFSQVPADFVLIKATGGNGYVNPACEQEYQSAKAAGKLIGLYHYLHETGFQADPVTEADFFVNNIQGYLTGEVILVLDDESDNQWDVGAARTFLDRVKERTGVKPVIYLNTAELNQSDWAPVYSGDYGLWVAQYAVTSPTVGFNDWAGNPAINDAPPAVNWGGNAPLMWQYADNARLGGWNGGLDANVLYGDRSTWLAYARPEGATAPAAPAPEAAPAPAPAPAPAAPPVIGQATVSPNDTLSSIADQVGVSLAALEAVNQGINFDAIEVGQVINMPAGADLTRLGGTPAGPGLPPYCEVSPGDTLSSIADQYGVSLEYIESKNPGIDYNLIQPSQRINL